VKIEVDIEQIAALTRLNCDHVIFSGNEYLHCDKNNNAETRGACCNSCWTRRWAERVIANAWLNRKEQKEPFMAEAINAIRSLLFYVEKYGWTGPSDATLEACRDVMKRYVAANAGSELGNE
jgi:hypothetical protein